MSAGEGAGQKSFEGPGEVIRRRLSLLWGAAAFYGLAWWMIWLHAPAWAWFVEQGLALTLVVSFAGKAYRTRKTGIIRADERGLHLDGRLLAPRRRIASAHSFVDEQAFVHFAVRRGRAFDVQLADEDQARSLLAALHFGVGQATATFRAIYGGYARLMLLSAVTVMATLWAGPLLGVQHPLHLVGPSATLGIALVAVLVIAFTVRVEVGSDGILLSRFAGRRFVPYGMLQRVETAGAAVVLVTLAGKRIVLGFAASPSGARSGDALARRIEEARAAYGEGGTAGIAETLVAPGGRSVHRWLLEVRALARARDYREAGVEMEHLWRVVSDPSAAPATRAGAAVALSNAPEDGETRARLRVASETCANPKLRVALARVADGATDAALAEALAPLVDAEQPPRVANR